VLRPVDLNPSRVSDDYMVCIWDAAAGTLLKTLKDHKRDVYGLAMSPDAQYYCTASMDGWLYIYSAGVSSLDPLCATATDFVTRIGKWCAAGPTDQNQENAEVEAYTR